MHIKFSDFLVVNFAHVVVHAINQQPLALRIDHFPIGQIVQGCAPQHGFFTARIHRHVTAHTRRISRGWVYREYKARRCGGFFDTARHHACTTMDDRVLAFQAGQVRHLHTHVQIEFFGINHRTHGI